jgi:hypothetical protein
MVINDKFYKWYPKVRREDIGKDTSNKFIDTCQISNPYCKLMGAKIVGPYYSNIVRKLFLTAGKC